MTTRLVDAIEGAAAKLCTVTTFTKKAKTIQINSSLKLCVNSTTTIPISCLVSIKQVMKVTIQSAMTEINISKSKLTDTGMIGTSQRTTSPFIKNQKTGPVALISCMGNKGFKTGINWVS